MQIAVRQGPDPYPLNYANTKVEMWCLALPPLATGGRGNASQSRTLVHLASLGQHWGPVLPAICALGRWAAYHLPSTLCKAGDMSAKNGEKYESHLTMTNCWNDTFAMCATPASTALLGI